jgi:translation initiation factor IF-2
MSSTTVSEFANELKKSNDTLLDQLKSAGVPKASASDALTDADKQKLLSYLQNSHGTASAERKKITLVKKSTTEIKQADASGKARTIQVEVRKKRTFVQRDDEVESPEPAEPAPTSASVIDHAELTRREEEASRQAELLRRQEEDLAERRALREAQEARDMAIALQAVDAATRAQDDVQKEGVAQQEVAQAAPKTLAQMQSEDAARKVAARAEKEAVIAGKEAQLADKAAAQVDLQASKAAAAAAVADQAKAAANETVRVAAQAKADDVARAKDLTDRRDIALAEALAIRAMMSAPKRVLVAKKPEEAKPVAKDGVKGTLHKPAGTPGAKPGVKPAGTGTSTSTTTGPRGAKTEVKSEKLSSSWGGQEERNQNPWRQQWWRRP